MDKISLDNIRYRITPDIENKDKNKTDFNRVLKHRDYPVLNWHATLKVNHAFKCHWGQRKLLFSEIELFNKVQIKSGINLTTNYTDPPFYVVYAGSAGGHHLTYLLKLFPALRFILYDPAQFDKSVFNNPKIHIKTGTPDGYFTDKAASQEIYHTIKSHFKDNRFQKSKTNNEGFDLIFISDIRKNPNERAIVEDMMLQQKWGILMNAYIMLLKFRLPYTILADPNNIGTETSLPKVKFPDELFKPASTEKPAKDPNKQYRKWELDNKGNPKSEKDVLGLVIDTKDSIVDYYCDHILNDTTIKHKIKLPSTVRIAKDVFNPETTDMLYVNGDIYWQITPPYYSTETRLMVFRNEDFTYDMKLYNSQLYEAECLYFNNIDNTASTYKYKDNQTMKLHLAGFDDSFGCTSEYSIVEEYIASNYKSNLPELKRIISLLFDINKFLYLSAFRKTLLECNIETFLKYIGVLQVTNADDKLNGGDFLTRLTDQKKKTRFEQLLRSLEVTTISCKTQKVIFKGYLSDNSGLLTTNNYNEQITMIDHSIKIQLTYLEKLEQYKSYRDIIKSMLEIRNKLTDTIQAPPFNPSVNGRPDAKNEMYQLRVTDGITDEINKFWDYDVSRYKVDLTKQPLQLIKYINVLEHKKGGMYNEDEYMYNEDDTINISKPTYKKSRLYTKYIPTPTYTSTYINTHVQEQPIEQLYEQEQELEQPIEKEQYIQQTIKGGYLEEHIDKHLNKHHVYKDDEFLTIKSLQ
jgi:hypothetical protein